jgi:dihydrofolate reductase
VWCDAAQQYLNAGLVDEMQLHLAPTLLGDGERLFDTVHDLHGLALGDGRGEESDSSRFARE